MRIVYHLGAHVTDEERLLRCLLKNRGTLAAQGILVPGPMRYRNLLRDTAIALKGQPASRETQAMVLEQILEEGRAERLILSWDNFLAFVPWAVGDGMLYPAAGPRTEAFRQIFPDCSAEFHLAIRNPASFLPEVFHRQKAIKGGTTSPAEFLRGSADLSWSDVVERIAEANPETEITLWCDEDAPVIWPEILAAVSGAAEGTVFEDEGAFVAELLSPEGQSRMKAYLEAHPVNGMGRRRKVATAFLERFGLPERLEQEIEMEGWTQETIARLTEAYEADVARIGQMPGVRLLRA